MPNTALVISVSSGVKNSVIKYEVEVPEGNVQAYVDALNAIEAKVEAWWSTHRFKLLKGLGTMTPGIPCSVVYGKNTSNPHPCTEASDHRHRKQEFWVGSSGVMLDLDLERSGSKVSWMTDVDTKALNDKVHNLFRSNHPPGNCFHMTPSGARLIFVFPHQVTDHSEWFRAASGAAALTLEWLKSHGIEEKKALLPGLKVDSTVTCDSARLVFSARSIAKGVPREYEVFLINPQPSPPALLATYAPPPPPPRQNVMSDEAKKKVQEAIDEWLVNNSDQYLPWPADNSDCPICGGKSCFKALPENPDRWVCRSAGHADGHGSLDYVVGVQTPDGLMYSGTALDMARFESGQYKIGLMKFLKKDVDSLIDPTWDFGPASQEGVPEAAANDPVKRAEDDEQPDFGSEDTAESIKEEEEVKFCNRLAYIVSSESYYIQNIDGSWNFNSTIGKESARKYLMSIGYNASTAAKVLHRNKHVMAVGAGVAVNQPSTYEEGSGENRHIMLNMYTNPKMRAKAGDWHRVKTVLWNMCNADEDPKAFEWLMVWCARKLARPGDPNQIAVVASGEQGVGKSLGGVFMQEILGKENCVTIGQNQLDSRFTASFAGKLFVLANEVMTRENLREASNHMKSLISDQHVMLEGKGSNAFQIRNSMSWWITSNEPIPVRIEGAADRHYTIFNQPHPPTPEFKKLTRSLFTNNVLNEGAREELAAWMEYLYHVEVDPETSLDPHINSVRGDVADATMDSVESFIREVEERGFRNIVLEVFPPSVTFVKAEQEMKDWDKIPEGVPMHFTYLVYREWCKINAGGMASAYNKFTLLMKRHRPEWCGKRETKPPRGQYKRRVYALPKEAQETV